MQKFPIVSNAYRLCTRVFPIRRTPDRNYYRDPQRPADFFFSFWATKNQMDNKLFYRIKEVFCYCQNNDNGRDKFLQGRQT